MNFVSASVDRSCSSGLNGLDPEQMVHNKVGRLSLETIDTWNTIFDGVIWFFSYEKKVSKKTPAKTLQTHKRSKISNIIYRSMPMTKEFDNKHARL